MLRFVWGESARMLSCPGCFTTCQDAHRFCHACGVVLQVESAADPLIGCLLPGGYLIRELMAEGGMGRIYRAEQRALERLVAVKVIHPHLAGDADVAARFLVEARAASRINHPNAVTVFAFGKTPAGQPYLVMQLLAGKQLSRVDEDEGPLPLERIVDILSQVLAALEQAHSMSVVHQDVKPDNIIVERLRSRSDLVKVIDFGLAHLLAESSELLSPVVGGTPAYMSPEHARGERVDGRSDLYSVGVILYELLTGRLPFEAASTTEMLLAVLNKAPVDPREHVPLRSIPDALAEATMRALSKKAADRFQTAGDFAAAMQQAVPPRRAYAHAYSSAHEPNPGAPCGACGARNAQRRAFCGECGAAMATPKEPLLRE
jgi:serine/threonine protein kinase